MRGALAPLEDVVVGLAGECLRVDDRQLLREQVDRILARHDAPDVIFRDDLDDVHGNRVALRNGHQLVG